MVLDGIGIYGMVLQYGLVFALFFGALLFWIYFWSKGRLDLDESPKFEMMENDDGTL